MATFISHSPEETTALGEQWGRAAQPGWVIGLSGDLGAGKTQLIKGFARGIGITSRIQSPTFALVLMGMGQAAAQGVIKIGEINSYKVMPAFLELYKKGMELAVAEGLLAAGTQVSDPLWRMPLWEPYAEMLASDVADLGNMADAPMAGAVTAALFLQKFVPAGTPWAHLDIAGTGIGAPSRKLASERARYGCCSLRTAFDSICRTRSLEMPSCAPSSSSVAASSVRRRWRTMRNSLSRRIALKRPRSAEMRELEEEIARLEAQRGLRERSCAYQ